MAQDKKPRNDLTDEQEYALRRFLDDCVTLQIALPPEVIGLIIDRMGYKVIRQGLIVRKDFEVKYIYGDPDPFRNIDDQYGPDGEELLERLNDNSTSTDEAGPSESPEGDEVGSVLQQDV